MQNAKRNSCKNDPVQTVDGSATNQLSIDDNASQQEQSRPANGNETHVLSEDDNDDDDDDDLFDWFVYFVCAFSVLHMSIISSISVWIHRQKTTQNLCEVEIKEESSSNVGGGSNSETLDTNGPEKLLSKKHKRNNKPNVNNDLSFSTFSNPLTTSFDVLNLLRNSSFPANKYGDEIQLIVEMQAKEHTLRMTILQTQLETAKLNRDIAEINKILILRDLQNNG